MPLGWNLYLKIRICLSAKVEETKMKSFIVFQGAKWEPAALNENFKSFLVVASSTSGWVNEDFTSLYLKKIF